MKLFIRESTTEQKSTKNKLKKQLQNIYLKIASLTKPRG